MGISDIVQFDPQDSPSVSAAMNLLRADKSVPKDLVQRMNGALEAYITGDGNGVTIKNSNVKQIQHATIEQTLSQYDVVAVKGVDRYYKRMMIDGEPAEDVYTPTDKEELTNIITSNYEIDRHGGWCGD